MAAAAQGGEARLERETERAGGISPSTGKGREQSRGRKGPAAVRRFYLPRVRLNPAHWASGFTETPDLGSGPVWATGGSETFLSVSSRRNRTGRGQAPPRRSGGGSSSRQGGRRPSPAGRWRHRARVAAERLPPCSPSSASRAPRASAAAPSYLRRAPGASSQQHTWESRFWLGLFLGEGR